jgi:uncharacterized protein
MGFHLEKGCRNMENHSASRLMDNFRRLKAPIFGCALLGLLIISGCSFDPAADVAAKTPVVIGQNGVSAAVTGSATVNAVLSAAVSTPPPAPTATETATPTPTPTPTDPLMIEVMRQQSYPGSDITIEKTLDPGANYDQYIASYLSEGNKIYALLTVPQGKKPATGWPVIVFNHGFIPPAQYRTTERYVAYVEAFARNGYIVIKPDFRGHGDSQGKASGPYGTPDYTVDTLNALASIKKYPDADPNRIGMWGHSMGGQVTLRAMVVSKDIKAGVIWGGVVAPYQDMAEKWHHPSIPNAGGSSFPAVYGRNWRKDFTDTYGSPETNPAFWASISPNSYLSDVSGPIQLHYGGNDQEVPPEFSQTLYDELKAAGKEAEIYTYKNDNHNISTSFNLAMQRSVQFFDQYVKEAGNSSPG